MSARSAETALVGFGYAQYTEMHAWCTLLVWGCLGFAFVGGMLAYLKMMRAGKESFCEPAQDATLERIKNAPTSAANMRNPRDLLAPTVISGARKTMIQFIQELDDVHLGAFPAAGAESKRPAANIVSADALKNAHKEISARVSEEAGAKLATSGLADDGWDGEDDIAFGGAPVVPVGAPFATLGVSDDGDAHIASISASHPRGSPRAEPESAVADDMQALRDQVKALEAALAAKDAALAAEVAAKDAVLATLEAVTAPPGNNTSVSPPPACSGVRTSCGRRP